MIFHANAKFEPYSLLSSKTMRYIGCVVSFMAVAEAGLPLRKRAGFLILLLGWGSACVASPLSQQFETKVRQEVSRYLAGKHLQATRVDIQAKLPKGLDKAVCDDMRLTRPRAERPPIGRVHYKVTCAEPNRWSGKALALVDVYARVVTASRVIDRGEVINPRMLNLSEARLAELRNGYEISNERLVGKRAKRRIREGQVMLTQFLDAPLLVSKGSHVTLKVVGGGFAVSTRAEALESGALGERVMVRNLSSDQQVEAVVVGHDTVEIR